MIISCDQIAEAESAKLRALSGRSRVPPRTSVEPTTCDLTRRGGIMPLLSEVRAMVEPDRVLVIGRATYERWLGTEPHEIDAAATALRRSSRNTPY